VCSWVSMLVCLQLSELVIFRYLSNGSDGLICFILLNLGDFCHHFFVSCLIFALIDCLVTEMLIGSCCWRNVGRLFSRLEPYYAASLAKVSALLLPIEFLCAATQVKDSEVLWVVSVSFHGWCTRSCLCSSSRKSHSSSVPLWILSIRYWAGCLVLFCIAPIVAWLLIL